MKNTIGLLLIFIITVPALAQPRPGDVFREYVWLPEMVAEQGKFLRVGGKLDYKSNADHFPADMHNEGYIPLWEPLRLKDAIKAELVIEKLGSHEDTKNLRISVNRHPSIAFPAAKGIPEPESDYMYHNYPIVQVPLDQLKEGIGNTFRSDVDTAQRWNWPQNIVYGVVLRIYYDSDIAFFKTEIDGISENGTLKEEQKLSLVDANQSIKRVEYIGKYEDLNWEGDGIYNQWHYHFFRGELMHHIGTSRMYPFEVKWNTGWVPDQGNIEVAARIICNNGLIYFTKAVRGLKLDRDYTVELCEPYDQPKNWVSRADVFTAKFDLKTDPTKVQKAKAYWVSWSPCYANGVFINDHKIFDRNTLCYEYMAHEVDFDPAFLQAGTNVIKTGKEPLHDGQMVHGMEEQWPGIMVKIKTSTKPTFKVSVKPYEGRNHFVVETSRITYFYDIRGGGFSRIIDAEGKDWITFKMAPWDEYPGSAAGAFRGLPNMVFEGDDGGAGHPGHDKCTSWIEEEKIVTESLSGKWRWEWTFSKDHVVLDVVKADPDRSYWFLYEGTPGGSFDPEHTFFGTDSIGPEKLDHDYYTGDIYMDRIRWMFTCSKSAGNTLYLVHQMKDNHPDMMSVLGNSEVGLQSEDGMTVFGFGRGEGVERYLKGRNAFVIGLYPDRVNNEEKYRQLTEFINGEFILK